MQWKAILFRLQYTDVILFNQLFLELVAYNNIAQAHGT